MGLLRQRADTPTMRSGEHAGARGGSTLVSQGIENRDLALVFLLGVFALAGAVALTIVMT